MNNSLKQMMHKGAAPPGPQPIALAANTKTNAVYTTDTVASGAAVTMQGITFNVVELFVDQNPTWPDFEDPWIADSGGWVQWKALHPTTRQLIVTPQIIPDSVTNNVVPPGITSTTAWCATGATGGYNSHATAWANKILAAGFVTATTPCIVRLGHEMNGNWYNHALAGAQNPPSYSSVTADNNWAATFAQMAGAMKAVSPYFLFDWNVNAATYPVPFAEYYPGDSAVDIIGVDQYDVGSSIAPSASNNNRWNDMAAQPQGLNDIVAFAALHNKPLSVPEWGLWLASDGGGGDNPYYVEQMAAFIATHTVSYNSFYNAGDGSTIALGSGAPNATAAYVANF